MTLAIIHPEPSPRTGRQPRPEKRRLIDNGLLHYEASMAGFAERYRRGETSHTIHVWWARRPHSAMRALLFASLCKRVDDVAYDLLCKIGSSHKADPSILRSAQQMLLKQYQHPPKVLDMFGGGGTIPFEALNLGAEAYAIDANELSVFIQQANLCRSQHISSGEAAKLTEKSGERVLKQLAAETAPLYPLRSVGLPSADGSRPIAYLWSYSTTCSQCGYAFFIIKRPWLSKKKGRRIALIASPDGQKEKIEIHDVSPDHQPASVWVGRKGTAKCPKCQFEAKMDISRGKDEIVAVVYSRTDRKRGKTFGPGRGDAVPDTALIQAIEKEVLNDLDESLPTASLPKWSGIINPSLYGISTHADVFNPRQRTVLLLLLKALRDEYQRLQTEHPADIAKFIISLLSGLIDQLVDWNCRLSMWISQNEQVGRAFCGPGVSMLWDYVETDPVLSGPSNLRDKLKRIIKGCGTLQQFDHQAHVKHAYAQSLPFENDAFDAIVTDPPYYDNIFYSALADFFFTWKRILLKKIIPDLFVNQTTDETRELVASRFRHTDSQKAHEIYCSELALAIREAARVLKADGVFSFIYTHSTANAWDALVRSFRLSEFEITSVQPLSVERKQRPRAMTAKAVNTCITFVSRKSEIAKQPTAKEALANEFRKICFSRFPDSLENSGWESSDCALALFAHGMALLANVTQVIGCERNASAIMLIENIVKERFPAFTIFQRKSL